MSMISLTVHSDYKDAFTLGAFDLSTSYNRCTLLEVYTLGVRRLHPVRDICWKLHSKFQYDGKIIQAGKCVEFLLSAQEIRKS